MAILYAVVARGTTVLSEFSAVTGNAGAVVRRILEKLPAGDVENPNSSRLCFSQDRYVFHILRFNGLSFLCMANDTFGRRIPFSYLEDIEMRFMKNYGRIALYAPAYAMNDEFSRVLHQQMEFFSSSPSADTLNRVRGEVNEIRTVMVDNIEKILERGDRIELLVDKTATMQDSAFHFRKQSKRLSHALWMKNAKLLTRDEQHYYRSIALSINPIPPTNSCHDRVEGNGDLANLLACAALVLYYRCHLWRHHST